MKENPQTLKDLKKIMRKASNERGSGVYNMFETPNKWGVFQFCPNNAIWINKGEMSILVTGDYSHSLKKANEFLNPLGWNMILSPSSQRTVIIEKIIK